MFNFQYTKNWGFGVWNLNIVWNLVLGTCNFIKIYHHEK